MNTHGLLFVVIAVALACGAQAQTPQTPQAAELSCRFVPGKTSFELTSVAGDLHVISGTDSVPLTVDMAAMQTRQILELLPSGEAMAAVQPDATTVRISMPGREIFAQQDRDGVTTLLNGVEQTPAGDPPKPARLRISRSGRITPEPGGGNDLANQLLATATALTLLLPERQVALGERWTNSFRVSLPRIDQDRSALTFPPLALTSASQLRSLQQEQGRLVATIVTTTDGNTEDGSSRQNATITTRFDAKAGELIEAQGTVSVNLRLPDPGVKAAQPQQIRLAGQIRFHTSVLASRTGSVAPVGAQAANPKEQPDPGTAPQTKTDRIALPALGCNLEARNGKVLVGMMNRDCVWRRAGLQPGDEIKAVNGRDVTGVPLAEIAATMTQSRGQSIKLFVVRSDKDVFSTEYRVP